MPYLGEWPLEGTLTFYCDTSIAETGGSQAAASPPTYRIYEAATSTPVYQSVMAAIDAVPGASITFPPTLANYLKLVALSERRGGFYASCAELQVFAGTRIPGNTMIATATSWEAPAYPFNVLDDDPNTFWHTEYILAQPAHPHALILTFSTAPLVDGIFYLPLQLTNDTGTIRDYALYLSLDGINYGEPVASGIMPLTAPSSTTTGWYAAQVPLQAASGFLPGRRYAVRMQATVAGVTGAFHHTFRIAALTPTTATPAKHAWRAAASHPALTAGGTLAVTGARMAWAAVAPRMARIVHALPAQLAWNPSGRSFPVDPQGRRGRLVRRPRRINWRFATRPGLGNVVRHDHPLLQGLVSWWLVRGWMTKGLLWYDLLSVHPGGMPNMGHNATSGWGGTTRLGGHGEVRFDGIDDYVDVGPGVAGRLALTNDCTMGAWIFLRSFGGGGLGRLIDKRGSDSSGYAFLVDDGSISTSFGLTINAGNSYGADIASAAHGVLTTGRWIHVMVTVAVASTVTFYVNGQEVPQQDGSGVFDQPILANTNSVLLGKPPNREDRYFDGMMDDVRIWSRRLSAVEAQLVYTNSLVGYPGLLQPPRPLWIMVSPAAATIAPARSGWRAATGVMRRTFVSTPARSGWRAATTRPARIVQGTPTRSAWRATTVITPRGFAGSIPVRMGMRAVAARTGHFIQVVPARMG